MMIKLLVSSLAVFFVINIISAQNDIDIKAPSLKLDIFINGEYYAINENDTLNFGENEIVIKTSNFMTFDFGKLRFDYPKHFAFEFEEDYSYKNWTLDGNDFVLMYFEFGVKVELDAFINEMIKKFGKKNCKVDDKEIRLGNIDLKGKRINVDVFGAKLTYDMYQFESNDFKTHFIAFQDSKNDDGSDSLEGLELMKIINSTIKLK